MTAKKNAARVAVEAAALPATAATQVKPRDVFDCIAMGISREDWEFSLNSDEARAWNTWLRQWSLRAFAKTRKEKEMQHEHPKHTYAADGKTFNLHDLYLRNSACGYPEKTLLPLGSAAKVAARLRGINAVSAVLIAGSDEGDIELGAWMRGGLAEAIHALAEDAFNELERCKEWTEKGGAA